MRSPLHTSSPWSGKTSPPLSADVPLMPPALHTSTSTFTPASAAASFALQSSTMTSMPSTMVTSPVTALMRSTPVADDSFLRHVAKTLSPRAASCFTSSRPIPEDAPVTTKVGIFRVWVVGVEVPESDSGAATFSSVGARR